MDKLRGDCLNLLHKLDKIKTGIETLEKNNVIQHRMTYVMTARIATGTATVIHPIIKAQN